MTHRVAQYLVNMKENTTKIKKGNFTYYINGDYESVKDFVVTVPHSFAEQQGTLLHAGRNEVRSFMVGKQALVVKRYKRVNWVQRVVYSFFRPSKAARAYRYARAFRERGIDTPHEVAYIEERTHGLFTIGYFVSLECLHPPVFHDLVEEPALNKPLADAVTDFILQMHRHGILHGDLNFGNFLYEQRPDGSVHFTVIDINRSHFCKGMPTRQQSLKNLSTTTHRRDLYEYIIRRYAQLRGWNETDAYAEATNYLEKMERQQQRKDELKHKLKK